MCLLRRCLALFLVSVYRNCRCMAETFKERLMGLRIKELQGILATLGVRKRPWAKQVYIDPAKWEKPTSPETLEAFSESAYSEMPAAQNATRKDKGTQMESESELRCPCNDLTIKSPTVRCSNPKCAVLQHKRCVLPNLSATKRPLEVNFFCEICRLNALDPFWETVYECVLPKKWTSPPRKRKRQRPRLQFEETVMLRSKERSALEKQNHELQVWCVMLNDVVSHRYCWPRNAVVRFNGFELHTTEDRPVCLNLREEGLFAKNYISKLDSNMITVSAPTSELNFCLGVRIVRKKNTNQIMAKIPSDFKLYQDCISRVQKCLRGQNDDPEIVADSVTLSLRCPLTFARIQLPGRFRNCSHLTCFDLMGFLEMNKKHKKWQCPVCMASGSLDDAVVDEYVKRILENSSADVTEVTVLPNGSWLLPKGSVGLSENANTAFLSKNVNRKRTRSQISVVEIDSDNESENKSRPIAKRRRNARPLTNTGIVVKADNVQFDRADIRNAKRRRNAAASAHEGRNDGNQQFIVIDD